MIFILMMRILLRILRHKLGVTVLVSHVLDEGELNFVCLCIVQCLLVDQAAAILCREGFLGFYRMGCCCQLECQYIVYCWTSFFL